MLQHPTKDQEKVAITAIINMINKDGGKNIGEYLSHYSDLDYHYKTSEGNGKLSKAGVYDLALENLEPDELTLKLMRENFEFDKK